MKKLLNKQSRSKIIGESWEISDVQGHISSVINGEYNGWTLRELIQKYPKELLGSSSLKEFPILLKFLDANTPLSVQVHPTEELAQKLEKSHGKTEMWYVVDASEDAELYLGWRDEFPKEKLINAYKNGDIKDYLKTYSPKKGEFYFVPAGSIHALGKGLVIAEIQQTSDVTYRIYDWGRTDRELHIEKAIAVTDYTFKNDFLLKYDKTENKLNTVIKNEFFETYYLHITGEINLDTEESYDVLMCIEGDGNIIYSNQKEEKIKLGETILIPASMKNYRLSSSNMKVLKIKSIPQY